MKCFDGQTLLTLERKENQLQVFLTGTQLKAETLEFLQTKVQIEASTQEDFDFEITYPIDAASKSLNQRVLQTKSTAERLELALSLQSLVAEQSNYRVPFMHPENIVENEGQWTFVHRGLVKLLAPMEKDEAFFLSQYKALIFAVLNPKLSYESFISSEQSLKDKFSQSLASAETTTALHQILEAALLKEKRKEKQSLARVPKGRYAFFKYVGSLALIAAVGLGVLTFIDHHTTLPKANAITNAQADFITNHYDKAMSDLQNYQPDQLTKNARFVLASSSVNLADLTPTQKSAILNNLSPTTDTNTLDFWIYEGRGQFEKALNLAKNIGDDQLTLLAYTELYQATKLNSTMNGDEKQKRLEEYQKQIDTLSKNLGK